MRRIASVLILISLGGVLLYYYWRRANKLPDWYTRQPRKSETELYQARKKVEAKITSQTLQVGNSNVELQLNEGELNSLIAPEITKKANSKIAGVVKAVKIDIKDGKIESGAVINISEISTAQLKTGEIAALTKVIKAFPALKNRDVYIGIEGKPTVDNGQLKLDENSTVKLGDLSFTTSELSQRLGIPESRVRRLTNLEFKLGRLKVNEIKLTDDKAFIKGAIH